MLTTDIFYILQWWVVLLSLGLIFLPLTTSIFNSFWDKGYIFSKILGLLILSYTIWFLSSLKLVPFNTLSVLIILGIFLILNSTLSYYKKSFVDLRKYLKVFLIEELLFTGGLIFWAYIRAHEPSIHGLEKFMDFGFINSILKTEFFPPKDMWLTPLSINYYYFGHLVSAVLTKMSGIDSLISYNLTLATLFGITLAGSFSLGANLYYFFQKIKSSSLLIHNTYPILLSGLLAAFLVTLGGNLHTVYAFFQSYNPPDNPVPFWQLPLSFNFSGYWYPNATRFIPFTIHEFPLYSFVVADLHGHVLNIPFVLLTLALLIKIFFSPFRASHASPLQHLDWLLLALLIATSIMTNVLDGPIYFLVSFFVILVKNLITTNKKFLPSILNTLYSLLIIILLTILFSLPFWLNFKPFASGVGVLCAPGFLTDIGKIGPFLFEANHCAHSPLWMLVILWGFFYFVLLGFIFFVLKFRFKNLFENLKLKIENSTDLLVLVFALVATILILIPEIFYAKDIYPAHYRANTVFKFGYQAFILLGLISGYMITRTLTISSKTIRYKLYTIPLLILFLLVAIYPYFAINSYYGNLKTYEGLNGLTYLNKLYPSDYQAILWMRQNIHEQPVILEAQGDSYTDFARVSSNTGLPTVIGWPVHEWLWRGSYDEAGKRIEEVAQIYESIDIDSTKQLLRKYNVSLVFIGTLERQKYTNLNEIKFQTLGKLIFQNSETRIYQIGRSDS